MSKILGNLFNFNSKYFEILKFSSRLPYSNVASNNLSKEWHRKMRALLELPSKLFIMLPRHFETSCRLRKQDRRKLILSAPIKDEGVEGEKSVDIEVNLPSRMKMFPDENTPNLIFNGIRFAELPICHIKATRNNTIMHLTDHKGKSVCIWTCGMEGFKNSKKGTNVAAQATAITIGQKCIEKGIKTLRVKVGGLGPGRMASVKGLEMAGLNIVSLTDSTPIPWNGPRPKKQRRL